MPICNLCGRMAATAEMRRSTKEGWLCKDKLPCKTRVKELKQVADWEKPGPSRRLSREQVREDIRYRNGW